MSSASWITSLSCSSSAINHLGDTSTSPILHWLRFTFLSPCPQRALLSSIDILFLLAIFVFSIQSFYSRLRSNPIPSSSASEPFLPSDRTLVRTTLWFKLSLIVIVLLTVSYTVGCIFAFSRSSLSSWKVLDGLFWLIQAVTYGVIAILLVHEKRAKAARHPLWLRAFWIANFAIIALFVASGIIRLINLNNVDPDLELDDILSFISFLISILLLIVAIKGTNGIVVTTAESEPAGKAELKLYESLLDTSNVSKYASASFISKAFWFWMNPLLRKGYKSPLHADDVPTLAPQHRAERMSQLFELKWPKPQEACGNRVRTTLLRCFWKDLSFTAFLVFVRYTFMYVGPVLIQRFVDYTSGKSNSKYEGYYLVAILFIAKFVEVLSGHQFNFHSQKLGMLMRSTIITALYNKGLRLSCSSRQAHGVGQIVNYMAVDAQQLADVMLQVHSLWVMPMQVIIALGILYYNIGISAVAALVALFTISILTVLGNSQVNRFQFNLMKERDLRLKATNEMLSHMRVVKFQAWEEYFSNRIQFFRSAEYGWLSKFNYTFGGTMALLWSAPAITATLTFGSAVLLGIELNAGMVFTATSLFRMLQEPIRNFPQSMVAISQAMISLERLDKYMNSKELVDDSVDREDYYGNKIAIKVEDGTFSWDDEGAEPVVKNLNFEVKKGELAAIVGTVGSGKSSLLASVFGEMHKISGKVKVCGTTAYVAQSSWIQNGTIQENILFGLPMDMDRYREVIRICSLEKDLEMMEYGDQTEIGEGGINISGGQKQRIQLARAVYQDQDTYILDDVFSAVDAHTGSAIYQECIRGSLKNKTILLVTHQVDFLHNVDLILVMKDGMIVQSGKYDDLLQSGMDFKALVAAHESSMELVEAGATSQEKGSPRSAKSPRPAKSSSFKSPAENGVDKSSDEPESGSGDGKLISEEEKETGRVSWQVYKVYFTEAFGWWGALGVLLLSMMWNGTLMANDYWLAYETSESRQFNPSLFIEVYGIIAAVSIVLIAVRSGFTTFTGLTTAQKFFSQMIHSVLHAPMSFFDTTPSGRILSRASADQTNIDIILPMSTYMALAVYITLLSIIVVTCQYAWPTVFFLIPLGWLNLWYRDYFLSTSRELTRLDSVLKAPVIHHFSESISGVMTIRSFKKQERFWIENINRVNANLRMDFHNSGSKEWLGFRLELIGSFILCISTIFMIVLPASIIKPENIGLSLSYGLSLNETLFWALYGSCFVENGMVAVERIKQFTRLPSEAQWRKKDCLPSPNWPTHGNVELKDVQVRYRPNTPLVLKGITLSIRGGEKIGVVGRTGGGKSTLIQVLFRLVEPSAGKIVIDDVDISTLGLHDLRSRFGIIPQEPVLFEGTIRSNIDPTRQHSDEEIWKSLERCQLKDVVAAKPEKLDTPVVDNGENWSVGQRQLICLGRVMLKHSRLLFMDEATASVDSQTDIVIQKIVREDFSACTIISIAHRIPTVMDCDKVLVLDAGWAVEYDQPARLLERPSLFAALVKEYANRSSTL